MNFIDSLRQNSIELKRNSIEILQVNIGKKCNLTCTHCHVEAGPQRKENMKLETVDKILELLKASPEIHSIDITGGAPELNPHFKHLVRGASALGKKIINRCNLTVLFEPAMEDMPEFFKEYKVNVVASLPCYSRENVEKQRGNGVFQKSIEALKILNNLGYAVEGTGLVLDLVYNPAGAFLPPEQSKLEADYKKELKELFNIEFNNLFTITNLPIKRFNDFLKREGKMQEYMQLLLDNFNPQAAVSVMCTSLVSIGWDGKIYDCDFNQMLELPVTNENQSIFELKSFSQLLNDELVLKNHCYGCTAGAGSSCGGALTN